MSDVARPNVSKMKSDIFHILNRGVEKRKIFLDEEDYLRFVYNLYDFNDINNVVDSYYQRREKSLSDVRRPNNEIVDVLCWCLMPNHIHLLVQEKVNGGTSLYSKKIIGGYTKYFNDSNERSGVLFQGRSKIILIKKDKHFIHMPYYIFSNPVKLIESYWKEKGIKNSKKAIQFLENYKWSSFSDITGKDNFPFIINKKLFFEFFDTNKKQFKKDFFEWLNIV
ncbi:hypothetical protein KKG15_02015 [Patescibacteria group bacterium]|nr:hypothetical protein [Patescibacteria group bacterium]